MKCSNSLDLDEYAQNTWSDEYNQEMAAVHALFIYLFSLQHYFLPIRYKEIKLCLSYDANCFHYY